MSVSQSHPSTEAGTHIPRSPVDLTKVKVGDTVTVQFTVHWAPNSCGNFAVVPGHASINAGGELILQQQNIVSHTPKALQVGDLVRMSGWGQAMLRILCIHGPWAWMADPDDSTIQGPLAHLERVS